MANELKNAHAFLILGRSLARADEYAYKLASEMLCTDEDEKIRPCGFCPSCIMAKNKTHPDINVFGRGKTSVDDVREMIREAYLAPNVGDKKVFILEGADKFNAQSQNAMLKILEEPPKGVYFVLTAANKNAILPTVLSRTFTVYPDEKEIITPAADGEDGEIIRQYTEAYSDAENEEFPTETVLAAYKLVLDFFDGKQKEAILYFPKKREEAAVYFRVFMLFSRNVFVYKITNGEIPKNANLDFKKICTKISAKKAAKYYEIFENAYLNNDEFANVNALYAYLSEKI